MNEILHIKLVQLYSMYKLYSMTHSCESQEIFLMIFLKIEIKILALRYINAALGSKVLNKFVHLHFL